MTVLEVGLVGAGRWGSNYLKTLSQLPGVRVAAVADPNEEARARSEANWRIPARPSLEHILSDFNVDVVVLATPDATHFELASMALAAGKDVLVEKPMAATPDEACRLGELSAAFGRILAVGHTAVYQEDFAAARERLQAAGPSSAYTASAARSSDGREGARTSPIHDLCPHDIAMAALLMGSPESASARQAGAAVEYTVGFADGSVLSGTVEWRRPPHTRRFMVVGGNLRLEVDGNGTWRGIGSSPLGRQCLDFLQSCRTRRPPISGPALGLAVVCCLAALDRSVADSGGWVPVIKAPLPAACG